MIVQNWMSTISTSTSSVLFQFCYIKGDSRLVHLLLMIMEVYYQCKIIRVFNNAYSFGSTMIQYLLCTNVSRFPYLPRCYGYTYYRYFKCGIWTENKNLARHIKYFVLFQLRNEAHASISLKPNNYANYDDIIFSSRAFRPLFLLNVLLRNLLVRITKTVSVV